MTRWPLFRVTRDAFEQYAFSIELGQDAVMHAADVFLCCACLCGERRAIRQLEELLEMHLGKFVRRIDPTRAFAEEVSQRLRERVLVGPPPRLAAYAGSGPLLGWLRVVAVRLALDVKRERSGRLESMDDRLGAELAAQQASQERDLVDARYRAHLEDAVALALRELSPQQKNILRLAFVAGLNIDEIGRICSVHRSTAARWIAAAEKAVFAAVKRYLREKHGFTTSEVISLGRVIRSRLELSLTRIL